MEEEFVSVKEVVGWFRLAHPDGAPEKEYYHICATAAGQIRQRIYIHQRDTDTDDNNQLEEDYWLQLKSIIPYKLREVILARLIEVDELLEQINSSTLSIWTTYTPEKGSRIDDCDAEHLTRFRAHKIEDLLEDLMEHQLRDLFRECDTLFTGLHAAISSDSVSSTDFNPGHIIADITRRIPLIVDRINLMHEYLQRSIWSVSKDNWKSLAKHFDSSLVTLVEQPMRFESEAKFLQAVTAVIKLARLYLRRLSRSGNDRPIFFFGPSMELEVDRLKSVVYCTDQADRWLRFLADEIASEAIDFHEAATFLIHVIRGCYQSSVVLEKYWDCLLESDNPQLDREMIAAARQWLNSWTPAFTVAARIAMKATGRLRPDHFNFELRDADNDNLLME
ncbi:hypothetical protein PtA15_8A74 [Puccinia triticina]|uniref:Exocyst complex component Sec6 n=1 Tax=Puccinia triticina TaxID=208348 RepID=A0ABY7CPJ5_9BASI|nr:uncharacterized protein PtA15_8A74 [Puccinia triticina]WAQ87173.1 hypothetical protein PtA15_8A74 [Puccinia triticina]